MEAAKRRLESEFGQFSTRRLAYYQDGFKGGSNADAAANEQDAGAISDRHGSVLVLLQIPQTAIGRTAGLRRLQVQSGFRATAG